MSTSQLAEVVTRMLREGEGVWMVRNSPSEEEIAATRADNLAWIERLPGHLAAAKELLAGHDAFDLLGGILMLQSAQQRLPPPSREPFFDGLMAGETAAMVLLERPARAASRAPEAPLLDAIHAALPHLSVLTEHASIVLSGAWEHSPFEPLVNMHDRFIARYMFVPVNETDVQARAWLRELFGDRETEGWLTEHLGFGVDDAESLVTAAYALIVGRTQGPVAIEAGVGQLFSLTAAELAERASVAIEAADAFCGLLSQTFGQPERSWPTLPTPLRQRPMLDDGSGGHLIVAPALLRRGLRYSLAAALNPALAAPVAGDERIYQRYLKRRGELLEARAIASLERFLKPTATYRNLHFRVRDAEPLEGEIDGVLLIDGTAIVVQAKSAATRIDAVAGDADRFRDALRGIVTEAMRQHDDARVALRARRDTVEFWEMVGERRVDLEVPDLVGAEILPVTVTLEDLAGCAPISWELPEAKLATAGELPWIVGLTPLEMMISLLEFEAQLIQFLRRRSLLNDSRNLDVADEIDIFMEYLHNHLAVVYETREENGLPVVLMAPERFHELDDWLLANETGDTIVQPPRQALNNGLRELLARLECDRPSGWLEVSVALLDGSARARKQVGTLARRVLAGKQRRTVEVLGDVTPGGEKVAIMLVGEDSRARLDDTRAAKECLEKARAHGQTTLIALIVPRDDSVPLRIVWRGTVPDPVGA
jgi:hypothetical protein